MAFMENEEECRAAGIDPAKVRSIASRLQRAARDAEKLGLQVFGGAHSGSLRYDDGSQKQLILAEMDGSWSGGDGATSRDANGLLRGE